MNLSLLPKLLISVGFFCIILGGVFYIFQRFGWNKLPGDIVIEKENQTIYIPIVSCLVLSAIASLLLRLLRK